MQGVIIIVGRTQSMILGDDGIRYSFPTLDWRNDDISPKIGVRVSFEAQGPHAIDVHQVPDTAVPDADPEPAPDLDQQGAIRRVAHTDHPGMIQGDDGVQYTYTPSDWETDSLRMPVSGTRVNFVGRGSLARSVRSIRPPRRPAQPQPAPRARQDIPKTRRGILGKVTGLALLVLVVVLAAVSAVYFGRPSEDYWATYAEVYAQMNDSGFSANYAHTYAEQIDAGHLYLYAHTYAEQIGAGKSPTYAFAFATHIAADSSEKFARAYAEQIDVGHLHWYAYTYGGQIGAGKSPTYARAYAEQLDAGFSGIYGRAYAELVSARKSPAYARAYADARFVYGLNEERSREIAEEVNPAPALTPPALSPIDAAAVLAMYSATDDTEADKRATSVREMTTYLGRGDMDNDTALGLLSDIAPGASIDERVEAASRLASISDNSDGELTQEQTMEVANELTRLITGHGIDAEQRAEAAREMVRLSQSGELNADNAAELMDTIAPEWSVTERKEALGYLALQFSEGEWDADSTKRTAEEGYTLITGGEIQMERRMEASIELAGEGLKRYGGDSYDDEGVDQAVALTQGAIRGDLTTDSVSNILGLDTGNRNTLDFTLHKLSSVNRKNMPTLTLKLS